MLTQERLKELLSYNKDTGKFTWLQGVYRGRECIASGGEGYVLIKIDGSNYKAHRLAFLYVKGYIPEYMVDHINGTRDDNRLANLRHASPRCNSQNRATRSDNTSGYRGVSFEKKTGKFRAYGSAFGKAINLGRYTCSLEAALARVTWEDWCCFWVCNGNNDSRQKAMAEVGR